MAWEIKTVAEYEALKLIFLPHRHIGFQKNEKKKVGKSIYPFLQYPKSQFSMCLFGLFSSCKNRCLFFNDFFSLNSRTSFYGNQIISFWKI